MPDIRQLSSSVVNKIAAGEVIERPASVVKELVENSVDAGARRIDVSVVKGGTDLVRVADDGCGIDVEQLPLAVASHATSKIRDADDLFQVATMGFRGEALASIAEVSQFVMRSRTAAESAGAELEVHGGSVGRSMPCGCPVGTTVEVRNLFFNTPVRRKFLRTTQTEMAHVSEAVARIALAHDDLHFTLTHNERAVHDLPATSGWRGRIADLFGQEIADSLMWVESDEGPIRISGYVADPGQNRGNNRMQYLFLNRRHIRDKALSHALAEAYRGLLMTGRYAICFLRLEMPADAVDVNVHPTKLEVRFRDSGEVYGRLLRTLRTRFLATDLTARPNGDTSHTMAPVPAASPSIIPTVGSTQVSPQMPPAHSAPHNHLPTVPPRQDRFTLDFGRGAESPATRDCEPAPPLPEKGDSGQETPNIQAPAVPLPNHGGPVRAVTPEGTPALQVYDRYLITESDEGVVMIDQHALHERILYEELREKVMSEAVEIQRLLVPEPITLTPSETAAVLESQDQLAKLGIKVEAFGGDTVLISSYPAMLANISPAEVLRDVLEHLMTPEKSPQRRDLLDSLLHMIACKAAIKAGDRLTSEEINSLIQRRRSVQDSHHCPHGRPTTLVFSRDQLDRMFGRS